MKLPRMRIGTLMLLVVIVALTAALVDERRRWANHVAELQMQITQTRTGYAAQAAARAKASAQALARIAKAQAIRCLESEGYEVDPNTEPIVKVRGSGWIVEVMTLTLQVDE